jgi:hypothetical protein
MLLAALLSLAPAQEVATIELIRGVALQNQAVGYWDVTDTYLNSQQPDRNYGGEGVLLGGPGKTILIRFGDLRRALGANKVKRASLVLTPSGGETPQLKSIAKVQVPWGEGPIMTLAALLERSAKERAAKGKEPEKELPPVWSATWNARRAGESGIGWQQAGASGGNDGQPISGAKLESKDFVSTITGLEGAVQSMIDRPYENYGFALTFGNSVEFFSSQSTLNRPKLVVDLEASQPKSRADLSVVSIDRTLNGDQATYTARVKNVGTEAAKGFTATWAIREGGGPTQDMPNALAPGAEASVTVTRPYKPMVADHRLQPIAFKLRPLGPDASAANDSLEVQESGKWVEVNAGGREDEVQEQVRLFNEVVLPQSRYSFAREGALERVAVKFAPSGIAYEPGTFLRSLGQALGLPNLAPTQFKVGDRNALAQRGSSDLFPGIMGYGDTRNDSALLGSLTLLYEPYWNPMTEAVPVEATGLLSMTDVALINQSLAANTDVATALSRLPDPVLLRAMDLYGRPLPKMELSFFQAKNGKIEEDAPAFSVVTDARGTAVLPKRENGLFGKVDADGGNGVFLVSASANGVTDWGWLKVWQLVDAYNRGGAGAAIFDMRFNLPSAPLESGADLALEKSVSSSAGTIPPKLTPVVDGDLNTSIDLPAKKGDWIEIDLGRDRTIGEIDLAGKALWTMFDVMVYATGQKIGEASFWAREVNWFWSAANRPALSQGTPVVAYRGTPTRVRYVRIINRSDATGSLSELKVVPAKL